MLTEELKSYLSYNPSNGDVYVLSVKPRKLIPDENNNVNTTINGIKLKIKYNKLVWFLTHGKLPKDDEIILHRNLDITDYTLSNLAIISRKDYLTLQESLKNLQGSLRMYSHPSDIFSYILEYRISGRLKREVISDVVVARKKYSRLRFKFIKFIAKYILTT